MLEILTTSQFLGQYVSKCFYQALTKTGYLITIRGIIHIVVLLVVLPLLSNMLLRWQLPAVKDLTLAQISAALITIGAMAIASSKIELVILGLIVESLRPGLSLLCCLLATSFIASQNTLKLNTIIRIIETIGFLFMGPMLAWLFKLGMKRKGLLLGLPYFSLAASFLLCLVGLFFIQSPQRGMHASDFQYTTNVLNSLWIYMAKPQESSPPLVFVGRLNGMFINLITCSCSQARHLCCCDSTSFRNNIEFEVGIQHLSDEMNLDRDSVLDRIIFLFSFSGTSRCLPEEENCSKGCVACWQPNARTNLRR